MADAVELAVAYIQVVPSMGGARESIAKEFIPQAQQGGDEAGEKAAQGFGDKWSSGMSKLGKIAVPAAVATATAGAGKALYDLGEVFDDVTDTIRVGTGASGEALDGMVDVARQIGKTVPAEFGNIGTVVADVNTRLGLSGDTLQKVSSQYLEAGRILGSEVDITKTSAAFSAFKIEGDNVSGALDNLFQVSQATGVGMNELASSVSRNAPAAQMLGFSFQDTAAMIGAFDKAGLNSQQLMASMSKSLVTLAKDGEEPKAAYQRVTTEIGNLLEKGDEAKALDLASKVFGTRGATQFLGAIKQGTLGVGDMMEAIGATSDTILGVGEETADFAEKWQLVKNNAMLAIEPLATAVFDALGNALNSVMPYLESLGSWLAENQWVLGVVAGVIGVGLVAAFVAWTASIWASTVALLANPITWIVLAVIALIAAIVALVMNWDTVVAWLQNVWQACVDGVVAGWNWLVQTVTGAGEAIGSAVSSAWQWVVNTITGVGEQIKTTVSEAWLAVTSTIGGAIESVVGWVTGLPGRILGALASLASSLAATARDAWAGFTQAVSQGIDAAVSFVTGLPGRMLSAISGFAGQMVNSGRNLLDSFTRGLQEGFQKAVDAVGDGIKRVRDFFPFSPAKIGPLSGHGYVTYSAEALTTDFADTLAAGQSDVMDAADRLMSGVQLDGNIQAPRGMDMAGTGIGIGGGITINSNVHYPVAEPASVSEKRALDMLGGLIYA